MIIGLIYTAVLATASHLPAISGISMPASGFVGIVVAVFKLENRSVVVFSRRLSFSFKTRFSWSVVCFVVCTISVVMNSIVSFCSTDTPVAVERMAC